MTIYDHAIEAECNGRTFIIREPNDLLEYGLQAREVSNELLQAFCQLHPEISHLYLRSTLNERGVRLVSKQDTFGLLNDISISPQGTISVLDSHINQLDTSYFLESSNWVNTSFRNPILMNTNDILRILDRMEASNRYTWSEEQLGCLLTPKEIIQMKLLKFIVERDKEYDLDPDIVIMFNKMRNDNSIDGIAKAIQTKQKYKTQIVKVIQKNQHFSFLLGLIKVTNKNNMKSATDLLNICCNKNWDIPFINIFLSGQTSSGLLPINNGSDICFKCPVVCQCVGTNTNDVDEIKTRLLYIRNNAAMESMEFIKRNRTLDIIKEKHVYQKFLFSYSSVVVIKGFLKKVGILKNDKVLYKDHGLYCPRMDYWRLEDDLLV